MSGECLDKRWGFARRGKLFAREIASTRFHRHAGGFNAYAEPIDVVALQNDCGDTSFVIDRMTKKKKKQGSN